VRSSQTEGYPLEGSAFGYVRLVHSLSEDVGRKCGCIVLDTRAKRTDCAMGRRRHMEENEGIFLELARSAFLHNNNNSA
jgi:hypothetical protein